MTYPEMDAQEQMYWSLKKDVDQEIEDNLRDKLTDDVFEWMEVESED